jgi:hypothetical protein
VAFIVYYIDIYDSRTRFHTKSMDDSHFLERSAMENSVSLTTGRNRGRQRLGPSRLKCLAEPFDPELAPAKITNDGQVGGVDTGLTQQLGERRPAVPCGSPSSSK